jgi:GNAT superfamily N-acetyltransferase
MHEMPLGASMLTHMGVGARPAPYHDICASLAARIESLLLLQSQERLSPSPTFQELSHGWPQMLTELPHHVAALLERHQRRCRTMADQIAKDHGSIHAYRSGLQAEIITAPGVPLLDEFYRLYQTVFTLDDEREPFEGFSQVLAFNGDKTIQSEFGPFIETVITLRDLQTKELVGAANPVFYAYPKQKEDFGFDASCQLNFILVRDELRGLGLGNVLLQRIEAELAIFARKQCQGSRFFVTCEQNNPSRMTSAEIVADAEAALIDPNDRMRWWRRRGFKRLDFPYVQPPLSATQDACGYLDYYVRFGDEGPSGPKTLATSVLREHLRRFFFVSVGKFAVNMDENREWRSVRDFLSARENVAIF